MSFYVGSVPILMYPIATHAAPVPLLGFFLLTDMSNFLLTNMTPLETQGD